MRRRPRGITFEDECARHAFLSLGQTEAPSESVLLDFEVGAAYLFENNGRYGVSSMRSTAAEVGQQRNLAVALRLAIEVRIARHTIIATWAPLDLTTRAAPFSTGTGSALSSPFCRCRGAL